MLVNYDLSSDEEEKVENTNNVQNKVQSKSNITSNNSNNNNKNPIPPPILSSSLQSKEKILIKSSSLFPQLTSNIKVNTSIEQNTKTSALKPKLPDVSGLLNSIKEADTKNQQSTENELFNSDDFRSCPPPEYSLKQEGEWMDTYNQKYSRKRRLPEEYKHEEESPIMDKYTKLSSDNVRNQLNEQVKQPIKDLKKGKAPSIVPHDGNRLIPMQARIKRANLATDF